MLPEPVQPIVYAVISEVAKQKNGLIKAIGGTRDHIHMLVDIPANISVSDFVKFVKGKSSGIIKEKRYVDIWFGWEEGYAAFTVSQSIVPKIVHYISHQKEHHRIKSFADELQEWLTALEITPHEPAE